MTLHWMAYLSGVALLIGFAALVLERIALWRKRSLRWIWVGAMLLSLLLPVISFWLPQRAALTVLPDAMPALFEGRSFQLPLGQGADVPPAASTTGAVVVPKIVSVSMDKPLNVLWWILSMGLAIMYAVIALRLWLIGGRAERRWIDNQEIRVTQSWGPAVFGFTRPIILMPRWILRCSAEALGIVIRHEREHIAGGDSRLVLLGWLLLIITPWNLPLWWQLRRLRFAIEVDCDARTLSQGLDRRAYGEVLLDIGIRRTLIPMAAIALTEPASQLLRRIQILTAPGVKRGRMIVAAAIGLSSICVALAADLGAPPSNASLSARSVRTESPKKLPPPAVDPRQESVRRLAQKTYPELFASAAGTGPFFVTLLLNQDGSLYASHQKTIEPRPFILNSEQDFKALGVDYERRGEELRFRVPIAGGQSYVDIAAWYFQKDGNPWSDHISAINRAMAEQYFPDLYTASMEWPRADPWVLLDRQGNVLKTGRRIGNSGADIKNYIESLYPGIRTAEFRPETIHPATPQRRNAELPYVNFVWLAEDSPIRDVSAADRTQRKDLFLYADISDGKAISYTNLAAMIFVSPAVVSARVGSSSIEYIEVTAVNVSADAVSLTLRFKRLALEGGARQRALEVANGTYTNIPGPDSTAWSPESAPSRVPYDGSGEVDVTDSSGEKWSIVLHPARVKDAA